MINVIVGDNMNCPSCGKELKENSKFCSSCGEKIEEVKPVEKVMRQITEIRVFFDDQTYESFTAKK